MLKKVFVLGTLGLVMAGEVGAACVSNYHALGGGQIYSYNPNGSANISVWMSDWDNQGYGGIAVYNTAGEVKAYTNQTWLNFVLPAGAHWWTAVKDVCKDGGFAGHWDRGPKW